MEHKQANTATQISSQIRPRNCPCHRTIHSQDTPSTFVHFIAQWMRTSGAPVAVLEAARPEPRSAEVASLRRRRAAAGQAFAPPRRSRCRFPRLRVKDLLSGATSTRPEPCRRSLSAPGPLWTADSAECASPSPYHQRTKFSLSSRRLLS